MHRHKFSLSLKKKRHEHSAGSPPRPILDPEESEKHHYYAFKRMHKNACRTIVCKYLEFRWEKERAKKKPSMWLISKLYRKKMGGQVGVSGEVEGEGEERVRKVSWSEEGEYVCYSVRKNSASIGEGERHTFNLD